MSRSYDFAVEIEPVEGDLILPLKEAVECIMGCYEISDRWFDGTLFIDASTSLCGGESDAEANDRLVLALRKEWPSLTKITTKWLLYTEYQEWDETYEWNKDDDNE